MRSKQLPHGHKARTRQEECELETKGPRYNARAQVVVKVQKYDANRRVRVGSAVELDFAVATSL